MSINNSVGLINVNMSWIKQMSIRLNLKYFTGRISIYFDGRTFNVRSVVIITIFRYRHILQNTCTYLLPMLPNTCSVRYLCAILEYREADQREWKSWCRNTIKKGDF